MGTGAAVSEVHGLVLQLFADWLREGGHGLEIARLVILGDSIRSIVAASGEHGDGIDLMQQVQTGYFIINPKSC